MLEPHVLHDGKSDAEVASGATCTVGANRTALDSQPCFQYTQFK
jgi:hypothetical protein